MSDNEGLLHVAADDEQVAQSTIAALEGWDEHNAGQDTEKRVAERHNYGAKLVVSINLREFFESRQPVRVYIATWTRNLSMTGLSMLASGMLLPFSGFSGETPIFEFAKLVREGDRCFCGLVQSPSSLLWVEGQVVRIRVMHNRMREIGIRFLQKSSAIDQRLSSEIARYLAESC